MKINLREMRLAKGKSILDLDMVKESGVSKTHIYEIEQGRRVPTLDMLGKLAKALDVRICTLYENDCPWSKLDQ